MGRSNGNWHRKMHVLELLRAYVLHVSRVSLPVSRPAPVRHGRADAVAVSTLGWEALTHPPPVSAWSER